MKHLYELVLTRRSIRQFMPELVSRDILKKLTNAARLAPSAANLQPLEFIVVDEEALKRKLFPCLKWAAYISPEGNPKPGHEPAAYVVILVNLRVKKKGYEYDVGAAVENMILTAWEEGIGSCWVISVNREKVKGILEVPGEYKIDSVLALGYPAEKSVVVDVKNSVRYWKDKDGVFHVPKRKLEDVVHFNKFGGYLT